MMTDTATANTDIRPLPVSDADKAKAEEIKAVANKLFAANKYEAAVDKYTEAISYNPYVAVYYSNRAFAYIKEELYGAAIRDADEAIQLDPNFVKGYYRRAVSYIALGRLKEAVKDLRAVCKATPQDRDARTKLDEVLKEIKRIEFEKAITFDEVKKSILERLGDIQNIIVEDSYDGPHLPADGITLEFVKDLLEYMRNQKKLHRKYTLQIMIAIKEYFEKQPTIVDITIPTDGKITVCGDIHGQYYDLLHVFDLNGLPSPTNQYLWNGDFVDRGSFSVECILALFSFKLLYPDSVFLTRGNHEADDLNKVYGFEGEVKAKYSELTFRLFSEIFNAVPLGNLINSKILVIHGGLFSRDDVTLDELRKIDRFRQPGSEGLMCELLWSDPQPMPGRSPSKRGVGLQFGPDVTEKFCKLNNLDCIIRSHEVKADGYEVQHGGKCITIFSAPNYCDASGNKGAYIHIKSDLKLKYNQFDAVPVSAGFCLFVWLLLPLLASVWTDRPSCRMKCMTSTRLLDPCGMPAPCTAVACNPPSPPHPPKAKRIV
ncbi:Metallo-dependent phosphatase-like protein [Entophlyctis helioformis]|nr:Metallo-dependent phosphatase-like protein [Entophlyctis helioformis]